MIPEIYTNQVAVEDDTCKVAKTDLFNKVFVLLERFSHVGLLDQLHIRQLRGPNKSGHKNIGIKETFCGVWKVIPITKCQNMVILCMYI